jgi:signal transduction histidine kinase
MRTFFQQNETIILFAHGLMFFSLGFALWLQRRRGSRLVLPTALIWFAAFAFVEALAIWGQAFVPIQERNELDRSLIQALEVLRGLIQTMAFLFLIQFGLRLVDITRRLRTALTATSIILWAGIVLVSAAVARSRGWSVPEWEASTTAAARYCLLAPGAVLSAVGLWRQRGELAQAGMTRIKPWAATAAGGLLIYAAIGGLIVEPAPWAPSGLNEAEWFTATGVPLAAIRGVLGLVLSVAAVKLLEIFEVEAKQRVDTLERSRAVAEERARFRRDLHDGTIQSIYAAGLHLEALAMRVYEPSIRGEVRGVVDDLNEVTDGIRRYITDLADTPDTPIAIAERLRDLSTNFTQETGLDVRFRLAGLGASGPVPSGAGTHLEQIVREALSNAARHAGPCAAEVSLAFASDELELIIRDDGCGLVETAESDHDGQGMRNMSERARRLGGRLSIDTNGAGTRVVVAVPLDSDVPEPGPTPRTFPEVITS